MPTQFEESKLDIPPLWPATLGRVVGPSKIYQLSYATWPSCRPVKGHNCTALYWPLQPLLVICSILDEPTYSLCRLRPFNMLMRTSNLGVQREAQHDRLQNHKIPAFIRRTAVQM